MSAEQSPAQSPSGIPLFGSVTCYHPTGLKVQLQLPCAGSDGRTNYRIAFEAVAGVLAAGFLVNPPGLEEGEQKEMIGWVLRREKENDDKTVTPLIDLYPADPALTWKVLSVYLNNDDEVAAFERACGMKLSALKVFPGTAAPQRGTNRQADSFIAQVPKPFGVVFKNNPKYDAAEAEACAKRKETYKVSKRKFERWDGQTTGQPAPQQQQQQPAKGPGKPVAGPTLDTQAINSWRVFLANDPKAEEVSEHLPSLKNLDRATGEHIWNKMIKPHADGCAWEFDAKAKVFVPPVEAQGDGYALGGADDPAPY